MNNLIYIFLFLALVIVSINKTYGQQQIFCDDFNINIGSWLNQTDVNGNGILQETDDTEDISSLVPNVPPGTDGTSYLFANDGDGPSFLHKPIAYAERDFSCATICYDYNPFSDGNENQTDNITHSFIIYSGGTINNPTLGARWTMANTITENIGWFNQCLDIQSNQIPTGWTIINGNNTLANWQSVINNVTGVGFTVDIGQGNQHDENIGLDNFCVTINNSPSPIFHLENAQGNIQNDFCEGEDVFINGIASTLELTHRFSVERINTDGSLSWYYNSPNYQSPVENLINLTNTLENNNPPKYLLAGNSYRITFVVGNDCDGWVTSTQDITMHGGVKPEFTVEHICRIGNELEITITGLGDYLDNSIYIYAVPEGGNCVTFPLPGPPVQISGLLGLTNTWTTTLPYIEGQCLVIEYRAKNEFCPWEETRETYIIPEIPEVDAYHYGTPLSAISGTSFFQWNFTPLYPTSSFPANHNWTIQVSYDLGDTWSPFVGFAAGLSTPNMLAILSSELTYQVCYEITDDVDEFCSQDRVCHIYRSLPGLVEVYNEAGEQIKSILINEIHEISKSSAKELFYAWDEKADGKTNPSYHERFEQNNFNNTISMFPNPTQDILNIQVEAIESQNVNLKIIDVLGNAKIHQNLKITPRETIQLNTGNLFTGIYFLNIQYPNGKTITQKFMVER